MAICAGVGFSKQKDAFEAGYEAGKKAMENCEAGQKPHLTIVFSSVSFDQKEVIRGVREVSGGVALVGCSDAGEITNDGPNQGGVAVLAIRSDQMQFHTGLGKDMKTVGAREAGQEVAKEVKEKTGEDLSAFIMFPDVLAGNGADVVRGVLDILGEHFPVVGGAAGDDFIFEKTYEYRDDEVVSGGVGGVGLSGKFSMGAGVRHGWIPIRMADIGVVPGSALAADLGRVHQVRPLRRVPWWLHGSEILHRSAHGRPGPRMRHRER